MSGSTLPIDTRIWMESFLSASKIDTQTLDWSQVTLPQLLVLRKMLLLTCDPGRIARILTELRSTLIRVHKIGMISDEYLFNSVFLTVDPGGLQAGAAKFDAVLVSDLYYDCLLGDYAPGARDASMIALMSVCKLSPPELVALDRADYDAHTQLLRILARRSRARFVDVPLNVLELFICWLHVRGSQPGPLFTPLNVDRQPVVGQRLSVRALKGILLRRAQHAAEVLHG